MGVEPAMAMPMNAASKAREYRDICILSPQLSVVCRKAACVLSARLATTRQQPALARRSDQSSRRMFGRRVAQVVRPEIILQRRNSPRGHKGRTEYTYRQAGKAFRHASRHVDALVAIDRCGRLGRTARHVARHLVR